MHHGIAREQHELERTELTLDPSDWTALRQVAHRALDAALDYQMKIRDQPAWSLVPEATQALLATEAPQQGLGAAQVVEEMLQHIAPYPAGHGHPRFWGWVCGTGTPIGMIADMLAAAINASAGTFNDAPSRVEAQLLEWMRQLFHFPEGSSGILTSGGSMANIIGLAVGRDAVLAADVRRLGLGVVQGQPTVYASTQVHSSVDKAMQLLGLGRENLRKVAVDEDYRIRLDLLATQIAADRARGCLPTVLVGNAGTVNTGAIDDLEAMAALAKREGMWFHIDGAIGALAAISPRLRERMRGLELADSLAFDFHKWLYVPYEAGCVLVRDGAQHRQSFSVAASYLEAPERGVGAWPDPSNVRGPQLSRGFKALKVWAQIREYGLERLGLLHEQNVAQIAYLAKLITAEPRLELLAPVSLNILCYRYRPERLPASQWDALNQELLMRIQEEGIAVPSSTRIGGAFCLRVANTNHRSRLSDFELLVSASLRIGAALEQRFKAL